MYIDHPTPGKGYLTFLYSLVTFILLMYMVMFWKIGANVPALIFILIPSLLPVGILLAVIHAAYHTEYRIENGYLLASSGWFFKEKLPLATIESVEPVKFIHRVLGWGFRDKGVCNRFRNGVVVRYNRERLYLSPSHSAIFIEAINSSL